MIPGASNATTYIYNPAPNAGHHTVTGHRARPPSGHEGRPRGDSQAYLLLSLWLVRCELLEPHVCVSVGGANGTLYISSNLYCTPPLDLDRLEAKLEANGPRSHSDLASP